MSERIKESTLVSHHAAIVNPDIREQYKNERVALIKSGIPIWILRGFNDDVSMDDNDPVYDFYSDGGLRGYVEGSIENGYQVYGPAIEPDDGPHHLNTEPVGTLNEAQKKLEEYIKDTYKV